MIYIRKNLYRSHFGSRRKYFVPQDETISSPAIVGVYSVANQFNRVQRSRSSNTPPGAEDMNYVIPGVDRYVTESWNEYMQLCAVHATKNWNIKYMNRCAMHATKNWNEYMQLCARDKVAHDRYCIRERRKATCRYAERQNKRANGLAQIERWRREEGYRSAELARREEEEVEEEDEDENEDDEDEAEDGGDNRGDEAFMERVRRALGEDGGYNRGVEIFMERLRRAQDECGAAFEQLNTDIYRVEIEQSKMLRVEIRYELVD